MVTEHKRKNATHPDCVDLKSSVCMDILLARVIPKVVQIEAEAQSEYGSETFVFSAGLNRKSNIFLQIESS